MKKNLFLLILLFSLSLNAQNQAISSKEAINDFEQLKATLRMTHINPFNTFDSTTFAIYEERALEELSSIEKISRKDYIIFLMKYLALVNDAHTSVSWASLVSALVLENGNTLPLEVQTDGQVQPVYAKRRDAVFYPFEIQFNEKKQVVDTKTQKIIASINGHNVNDLFEEAMLCQGGVYSFRKHFTEKMFFSIFLYLKNINAPFIIAYNDRSSKSVHEMMTIEEVYNRLFPIKSNYTFEILDNNIGLISYNQCIDKKAFKRFLKSTFAEVKAKNIDKLIIDIRQNTGGNSDLNDELLAYLTTKKYRQSSSKKWLVSATGKAFYKDLFPRKLLRNSAIRYYLKQSINHLIETDEFELTTPKRRKNRFNGKVCLLTSSLTFSSANFLADAVSTYDLMPIIGQPTGEYTNDFGEQVEYQLPFSKIKVTFSTAFDVGANADAVTFEVVQPDILVEKDALEYAIEWILKN